MEIIKDVDFEKLKEHVDKELPKYKNLIRSLFEESKDVRKKYLKLGRNDTCVCGSGKKFKKCKCSDAYSKSDFILYNNCRNYYLLKIINDYKNAIKKIEKQDDNVGVVN